MAVKLVRLQPTDRAFSDLDHLEIFLTGAAVGAPPGQWDIIPTRARGNAGDRIAFLLLIDIAANHAHVSFHLESQGRRWKGSRIKAGRRSQHKPSSSILQCVT